MEQRVKMDLKVNRASWVQQEKRARLEFKVILAIQGWKE
jgi:hypothetical protein